MYVNKYESKCDTRTVDTHIKNLREKINIMKIELT